MLYIFDEGIFKLKTIKQDIDKFNHRNKININIVNRSITADFQPFADKDCKGFVLKRQVQRGHDKIIRASCYIRHFGAPLYLELNATVNATLI